MNLILVRLKEVGAQERIWKMQYGCKSHRGTTDALLLVRRIIEQSRDRVDRKLLLLSVDWEKAFNSLVPHKLIEAVRRFGIPIRLLDIIFVIYRVRWFYVRSDG